MKIKTIFTIEKNFRFECVTGYRQCKMSLSGWKKSPQGLLVPIMAHKVAALHPEILG